ncbi:hypothetical protein [Streptomyces sp. CBG33]|uniref:hypothetical protein n=1 Tax=Streptomyces sp. CBG33 TaxID=2762624 RepID=UPI00164947F8|nr:hypothetical protein [Streptomyces sp. CBG33]
MSDDLRDRLAKALSESDGLPWSDAWASARSRYYVDVDALMPVIGDEMVRLRADLLTAQRDRDTVFKELERERAERLAEGARLRELLTYESQRADGAIAREESSEAHAEELEDELREMREYAAQMERERDNYRTAYKSKPAVMRLEGPGAEDLAARIADVDDLKATIVSQAREIARLKGESA